MKMVIFLLLLLGISKKDSFGQANKSVFFELLGNGIGISANFDSRITNSAKGFGFRAGIGLYPGTIFNAPFVTFPLGLNHLVGKGPHYLESGVGVTVIPGIKVFWNDEVRAKSVLFIPSAGYRYARKNKGFQGRIFVSPWIGESGVIFIGGLSAGFSF